MSVTSNSQCLVCDGDELSNAFISKGYAILKCQRCGFFQVAAQPDEETLLKLYADLHVKHGRFRDNTAAARENRSRLALVLEFAAPRALILDAGCATGDFLALAEGIFESYGLDVSTGAIEEAKRRLPEIAERLRATSLENHQADLPLFDAICLWDVIEHVREPVAACQRLLSILKPGGYLFISTPDIGALTAKAMRQHWAFMIPPFHLGFFSRKPFHFLFRNRLPAQIVTMRTRGKWTSVAFVLYKLNQISGTLVPGWLLDRVAKSRLGKLNVYIPTNDVMYLVAQKNIL
jgi:2-polyprenyl-3-methyl-5-hydroxy-6-metoxy-1,4-benzoquinol methylase